MKKHRRLTKSPCVFLIKTLLAVYLYIRCRITCRKNLFLDKKLRRQKDQRSVFCT